MVCTTEYDACVWVYLDVDDFGVVGASNVDEGVELYADGPSRVSSMAYECRSSSDMM